MRLHILRVNSKKCTFTFMCYDIQAKLQSQLKRAKANNDHSSILELTEKLERFLGKPLFHASGFDHPELLIYPGSSKFLPIPAFWGLIPHWTASRDQAMELWNKTLNARGESIFEKASFKDSAESKRCIIPIDGFFEHRHVKGNTIPYFIQREDNEPMNLAGLYNIWKNPESQESVTTFTIVTSKANSLMSMIHNNPKIAGPRMPFVLENSEIDVWLDSTDSQDIHEFLVKGPKVELKAHTVQKLKGARAIGNKESVTDEFFYSELGPSLFD